MAPEKRRQGPDLKHLLREEFFRFDFFQAVTLIEQYAGGNHLVGATARPQDEPVQFKVRPDFAFPASDLKRLHIPDQGGRAEMEVTFLGLIGPNGVLPHWYHELAMERSRAGDGAMVDFFNVFHHRLLTLFFLAWKRSRICSSVDFGGKDRYSVYFRSLIGLPGKGRWPADSIGAEPLLYLAGHLARRVPTAIAITKAASYWSRQPARVEQFIERVLQLPPEDRTRIGKANSVLGESAVCGSQVTENTSKFRIELGPMGAEDFSRFLPGGKEFKKMFSLLRFMVGIEYEFDICIILKKDCVPGCRLGAAENAITPLLGWSTWIKAPETSLPRDQRVIFEEPDALQA